MGSFRFRKQIKLAPGVKLNINKQSLSVTAGVRGAHATLNTKGQRTLSAGLPGTGLSYRDTRKVRAGGNDAFFLTWYLGTWIVGLPLALIIMALIYR